MPAQCMRSESNRSKSHVMNRIILFVFMAAAFAAAACGKNDGGGGAPAVKPFEIAVTGETTWTAEVAWTPKNIEQTYVGMVVSKEEFDAVGSDAAYIADDLAYFQKLAEYFETDLAAVIESYLVTGADAQQVTGLKADTEYYAYAYGLEPDGTVTTQLVKTLFRTAAVQPVSCTFEIAPTQVGSTSARVFVTPSDRACTYFRDCVTREEYDAFGGDDKVIPANIDLIERAVEIFQMAGQDKTFLDFLNTDVTYSDLSGLQADTEYVVFAFGVDPSGTATTPLAKDSFRTGPVAPSSLTFESEVLSLNFNGARIAFTPSNAEETFFTDCVDYETYASYPNDAAFMESIVAEAGASMSSFLTRGYHVVDAAKMLLSRTRYVAYAFGYAGGITTGMAKEEFTTPAMPSGGVATVDITPVVEDGNDYYARDEIVYAGFRDKAYVQGVLSPSVGAAHWYGAAFKSEPANLDDLELAEALRTAGYEDKPRLGVLAAWGAKVPMAAVAVDSEGRSGVVKRISIGADRSTVSAISGHIPFLTAWGTIPVLRPMERYVAPVAAVSLRRQCEALSSETGDQPVIPVGKPSRTLLKENGLPNPMQ